LKNIARSPECPGCIYGVANGSLPRPCWPYSSLYEYNDLDKRFDAWKVPALIPLKGIWVGNLSAMPVLTSGTAPTDPNSLRLQDTADALLYFGPRDTLTGVNMSRADLEGTPYGREIARRLEILIGQSPNIFPAATETPQFPPGSGGRFHRCRLHQKAFTILCHPGHANVKPIKPIAGAAYGCARHVLP